MYTLLSLEYTYMNCTKCLSEVFRIVRFRTGFKKMGRRVPPAYFTCNTWGCDLINSFTVRQRDVLSKLALSPFRIKITRTQLESPLWNPWSATDLLLDVSRFPFVIKSSIVYVQFSIILLSSMIYACESSTWSMYV